MVPAALRGRPRRPPSPSPVAAGRSRVRYLRQLREHDLAGNATLLLRLHKHSIRGRPTRPPSADACANRCSGEIPGAGRTSFARGVCERRRRLTAHDRRRLVDELVGSIGSDDLSLRPRGVRHGVHFGAGEQGDRSGKRLRHHSGRFHPRPLWLLPSSWANWADFFKQAGYAPLTPTGQTIRKRLKRRGRTRTSSPRRR
jgi:hypothetical protein